MSKYHNDNTAASDNVPITLSDAKLKYFHPELYGIRSFFTAAKEGKKKLSGRQVRELIGEHMRLGDSRAALVVRVNPILLVAAYTDEQDAVVLLQFPAELVDWHQLQVGTRLLTVNTYRRGAKLVPDLLLGPASLGRWVNFHPIIAEFVSDSVDVIETRKLSIQKAEWQRTAFFAKQRLAVPGFTVRDGRPRKSMQMGKPLAL